jgi:hypothetical protein
MTHSHYDLYTDIMLDPEADLPSLSARGVPEAAQFRWSSRRPQRPAAKCPQLHEIEDDRRDDEHVNRVVTILPMIRTAMRFMMSEPTPVLDKMGTRPAITTLTVISLGRSRSTDPAMVASWMSRSVKSPPWPLSERFVQIHDPSARRSGSRRRTAVMQPTQPATEKL